MRRASMRSVIQSLHRGFRILETVGARGIGMPLAEIKREVGLHASTTFHLLRTLMALSSEKHFTDVAAGA